MGEDDQVRTVVILGSTGSIGTQALDVIAGRLDDFHVVALAAGGGDPDLLAAQAIATGAGTVAIAEPSAELRFREAFGALAPGRAMPRLLVGPQGVVEAAAMPCDVVLNGITGSVGLQPTLAALKAGSVVALANKESLIVGGPLVKAAAAPGQIVPVDSEHSALAQCLRGGRADEVRRLVLTASGGPFRGRTRESMDDVTPAEALKHPTWAMGPVVTINSATLMNKGLEVIEAHLLFDISFDHIDVVVHPQSIVHSMVEFVDGSTLAQVSPPDMRLPIALGLAWPDRVSDASPANDWTQPVSWDFMPLDDEAFPAVQLAREVGRAGGVAPAIFNAANEVCVEAFLAGRLPFLGIVDTVADVVSQTPSTPGTGLDRVGESDSRNPPSLADVLDAETWARDRARALVGLAREPVPARTTGQV